MLRKDNCKLRRETFQFWDWVQLILEILWYFLFWQIHIVLDINNLVVWYSGYLYLV